MRALVTFPDKTNTQAVSDSNANKLSAGNINALKSAINTLAGTITSIDNTWSVMVKRGNINTLVLGTGVYIETELLHPTVGVSKIRLKIKSASATITGNIVLIPIVNDVAGTAIVVPVLTTEAWHELVFATPVTGKIMLKRDYIAATDTLKDGGAIISAEITSNIVECIYE